MPTPQYQSAEPAGSAGVPQVFKRGLKSRHVQMIAIGGSIGTGLFYGSAQGIALSGPAIILGYALCGMVMFLIVRALGEMTVREPVAGAFSHFAYKYWSPRAGFVSGWNYWFNYIAVSMVELAVVGAYVNYWLPGIPPWLSAAFFVAAITAVNLLSVKAFGEFEYWFAMIKVAAIIGMIVLGAVIIAFGINKSSGGLPDPSMAHLWDLGGFMPGGMSGFLLVLVVVLFSYGGTELIGITAGEAEDPQRTIPQAINQLIIRFLIFYIGSMTVILAIIPWDRIDGQLSPFVQIFQGIGLSGAPHVLNFVVLTAAMSAYNSALYSNARMLHSLSEQGNAPKYLSRISRNGVPLAGVLTSTGVTSLAVLVVFLWPEFAFNYLLSIALIAGIINWTMIVVTHGKFRRRLGTEETAKSSFRLPGGRFSAWIVLLFMALVIVQMAMSDDYRTAVIAGPAWLAGLLIAYAVKRRRQDVVPRSAPSKDSTLSRERMV